MTFLRITANLLHDELLASRANVKDEWGVIVTNKRDNCRAPQAVSAATIVLLLVSDCSIYSKRIHSHQSFGWVQNQSQDESQIERGILHAP